jgi:hypothetical protein
MRTAVAASAAVLALAAPAGAAAAPAQLSRADAAAGARAAAAQLERGLERFGYHRVKATVDRSQRLSARRFRTVVGLVATATRAGARDGSCLLAVYTWQTRDHRVASASTSITCTPLF